MQIEHLALWVRDLEGMRDFYLKYFDTTSGEKYVNPGKQFTAYFILFGQDKTRLELMTRPDIIAVDGKRGFNMGLAHFTISVGGKDQVNALTERLRKDNYTILGEPRTTGDGYYESVVLDPEGNILEISASRIQIV
ncbi:MAG TPA: VOC family protein [Puia sp.]|nr:VOC family protein [Puia sp.]